MKPAAAAPASTIRTVVARDVRWSSRARAQLRRVRLPQRRERRAPSRAPADAPRRARALAGSGGPPGAGRPQLAGLRGTSEPSGHLVQPTGLPAPSARRTASARSRGPCRETRPGRPRALAGQQYWSVAWSHAMEAVAQVRGWTGGQALVELRLERAWPGLDPGGGATPAE